MYNQKAFCTSLRNPVALFLLFLITGCAGSGAGGANMGALFGVPAADTQVATMPSDVAAVRNSKNEESAWAVARKSQNTDVLYEFLAKYPNGQYASEARAKLKSE